MSSELFLPYKIGNLVLKNRFVRSATGDATADKSGGVTDASIALYRDLSKGAVGLIISGHAFVSPLGRASYAQYGVHNNDMIPGLRSMVKIAHKGGASIALQIAHAGININYRQHAGLTALAVSALPEIKRPHREMTDEDIEAIVASFATATARAAEAGFDAVQLHGAHGYLLSQFLSPLYNHRTDRWGGSPQNRRRFHVEVLRAIRHALGNGFPVLIKLGTQDDRDGGLQAGEGIDAARELAESGIDAIEVSSGFGSAIQTLKEDDGERTYFRKRAALVKQAAKVPVIAVGGIRSLKRAENIIESGDADLISLCRPFIREPGLIDRWQKGDTLPAHCISCNKCMAILGKGEPLECGEERRLREQVASTA